MVDAGAFSVVQEKAVKLLPLVYRLSEDTLVSILQYLRATDLISCSETGNGKKRLATLLMASR